MKYNLRLDHDVRVYTLYRGPQTVTVSVEIDSEELAKQLAQKAYNNKGKAVKLRGGAVAVSIVNPAK